MRIGRKGFTLVELLAVIAIILILMTLLIPQLGRIADMGRSIRCMNSVRQIGIGVLTFASDHTGRVPGGDATSLQGPEPWEKCWMGREVFPNAEITLPDGTRVCSSWPTMTANDGYGTLVPYIGGEQMGRLYKCPTLAKGPRIGEGIGSNGYFDFSIFHVFCGSSINLIPLRSTLRYSSDPATWVNKPTPLVVEEDPYFWLNRSPYTAPSHGNQDRIGTWHNGKGNYLARDGSAQTCAPADGKTLNPTANDWYTLSPNGNTVNLGGTMRYDSWKDR